MVIIIRLAVLMTSLLGVFSIYRGTLATPGSKVTVFKTVYSHCILVLVCLGYYCLAKLIYVSCRRSKPKSSLGALTTVDMVTNVPRLTIYNVWILVYGLGLVFFITGYCFLGLHSVCLACAGFGVGVLSLDELVCPRTGHQTMHPIYIRMRYASLITALVSLVLVSSDLFGTEIVKYITTIDLYSLFFGMGLPFASQFIMIAVRDNRRHNLSTVIEVCEFGFPFATFLGIFHLGVAYGQRFQLDTDSMDEYNSVLNRTIAYYDWYHHNFTAQSIIHSDGPFILFYTLAPLLLIPGMVCYVTCILEGMAIDTLVSLTLALCIEHLIVLPTGPASVLGIYGTICCAVSISIRILSEYRPNQERSMYFMQTSHLPQKLSWASIISSASASSHLAREAEDLTSDLEPGSL